MSLNLLESQKVRQEPFGKLDVIMCVQVFQGLLSVVRAEDSGKRKSDSQDLVLKDPQGPAPMT